MGKSSRVGFIALGPEWPWRDGGAAPSFRPLGRRSGRFPAVPYPPPRCCQYNPEPPPGEVGRKKACGNRLWRRIKHVFWVGCLWPVLR